MLSDIEIAKKVKLVPINKIAENLSIPENDIENYGRYKAKIKPSLNKKPGKLVLVTAINPTPAGEGKTTTSVGLAMALNKCGKKAILALREPSLGPVFGVKGGAAGGGYSQVLPMEDINLHFTGDLHAVTTANNLICALIDNHITQGNTLNIDPTRILFRRCMDMNDRALRNIVISLGGKINGLPREDKFNISVASEIMAILCLSSDITELKMRISKILIAYSRDNKPIFASDLKAQGAAAALLKDAIFPNLVQTIEGTPAFIHGGPFANIAHGCNSVLATKTALSYGDICVTEAGFGSDLGAEKFIDIKCRQSGIYPDVAVIVATIRALKHSGGALKNDLNKEDLDALKKGISNLQVHIENLQNVFKIPTVVALNKFSTDTGAETSFVKEFCENQGANFSLSEVFEKGGEGGIELAGKVISLLDNNSNNKKENFVYSESDSLKEKINKVATKIYRAKGVTYTAVANRAISSIESINPNIPICIAKTQYSLSDDPKLLGKPENFNINVTNAYLSNGAGFAVILTGDVMTMPGLPKIPAAENIDIDADSQISGLF